MESVDKGGLLGFVCVYEFIEFSELAAEFGEERYEFFGGCFGDGSECFFEGCGGSKIIDGSLQVGNFESSDIKGSECACWKVFCSVVNGLHASDDGGGSALCEMGVCEMDLSGKHGVINIIGIGNETGTNVLGFFDGGIV